MENDDSNSFNGNHSFQNEQDSNKSFVDKVKSRMTGILSSSFNKLFGNEGNLSLIRRRDDNEEDIYQLQPPSKKIKKSLPGDDLNNINLNSVPVRKDVNNLYKATESNSQNIVQNTFAKPIPGPSGIKSRKTLADAITCNLNNDDKDSDSGESTSGYSSMARISHKDVTHSGELKKVETTVQNVNSHNLFNTSNLSGHTRSLFTERSLSPQMNSSLSSRRPYFNASTFGSPSFIDRTLSTKRIISSPFYSGRTMYGGASAYNKRQKKLSDSRVLLAPQIEVKSVANAEETVNAPLSKTARRILETLEGFTSTTLLDVKKIPSPRKIETSGLLSKYTGANPYSIKDRKFTNSVSNKELLVPTIPDMLQMKRKEKLQNTTESVRKIAVASNSSLNNDGYKIRNVEDETSKHTNKFRHKISSVRHKPDNDNAVAEQVNLPNVTLPITNLPKFDFTLPLPSSCSKYSDAVPVEVPAKTSPVILPAKESLKNIFKEPCINQSEKLQTKIDRIEYKFSNPEVLAENLKAITAINDFKFSDPVFKKLDQLPIIASSNLLNFKSFEAPPLKLKKKLPNNQSLITSAPKLLIGSVEDVLNKNEKAPLNSLEKFKPAVGMWECNTCLIRNLPDKQVCVSCTSPKSVSKAKIDSNAGFGDKFKMSSEQWECSVCMLRNDNLIKNCVACTTPRISNSKPTTCNVLSTPVVTNSFGNKFKPPKDTWECSTCMIRNQESAEKCIACETAKPGAIKKNNSALPAVGFGDLFQKKSNEWECSVCMVRNPNDKVKCLSCETPNPRASTSSTTELSQNTTPKKIPTFMFGIFPGSKTTGTGFKTDEKPISDAVAKSAPISSIFGNERTSNVTATSTPKTTSTYTFGIPKVEDEVKKINSIEKSQVPESKIAMPVSSITFNNKLGNTAESVKPSNSIKDSQEGTKNTYTFGSGSNTKSSKTPDKTENTNKIENSEKANEKSASQTTGFTFGSSIPPVDKEKSTSQLSGVTFGSSSSTAGKEKSAQPTGFTFGPPTLKRSSNHVDEHDSPALKRSSLPAPTFNPAQQIANDKNDADILKKAMSIGKESTKKGENNLFSSLATSNVSSGSTSNNAFGFMSSQAQPTLPTTTSPSSNLFSFGSKMSTVEFGKTASKEAPLFKIANSNTVKLSENNKTTFDVTTAAPSTISSNVFTNTSTSSVFGASSKPTFETTNPPFFENKLTGGKQLFESLNKPAFDTTNKPLFKLDQAAFKTSSKITFDTPTKSLFEIPNKPIFDSASNTSAASTNLASSTSEIKPFSFGTSENNAIKPSTFSFGPSTDGKVPEPSQPPPVFGFGSSVGTSASSNTFSFNSTASTPNSSFNFTSPKMDNSLAPFQSSAPSSTLFGSSSQAQPVQNGGFNFGSQSSSNAVKTGFNFGTAPPAPTQFNAQPSAASGGFSFGSSNQNNAQPSPGGFNFGAMAAPPTFNANVTPAFNFTGGATPTFSAQPPSGDGLGPLTARKKIKAVRRTHPR